jgi:putative peptidoglycan lipid II flippase
VSKSLRNISVVAAVTMGSRVLGLVRDMLLSAVFGTTALASAFVTAFTLPNLFRRLLGEGALTAAFVPTLNEELTRRQRAGAFVLVSQVASWLLVVTTLLVILAVATLGNTAWLEARIANWDVRPETAARWLAGTELAAFLFPYMIFVCLAAVFSAALQTLNRFLEPALSPVWLNLAMIGMLGGAAYLGWSGTNDGRMRWLCTGVLIGGFLQMVVPAVVLMREGWRPAFDLRMSPQIRSILRLMGPTVFGSAIYLINMSVSRLIGLSVNDAAAAVLNLATRLMELPIGVFAVAVSTVVFPLISRYAAQGDWQNLTAAYRQGMRLILVINIPAAVGLTVLAEPVVRLLFQRGAFQAEDTLRVVPVLAIFAFGLPFFSFVNLVLRAFYAQKDTATPVRAALISFLVNVVLSVALMKPFGTIGLAMASNLAVVVQAWYLQSCLARKRSSLGFRPLVATVLRVLAAAGVMGGVVGGGWILWSGVIGTGGWADATALVVLIPAGVGVYGGLLWALRIEGRDELKALLLRRLRPPATP